VFCKPLSVLAIKRRVTVAVLCLTTLTAYDRSKVPAAAVEAGVERRYIQSRCITFAYYAYRYRIGESVSVENDVLGLTLVDAKVLLDKIH